MERVIDRFDSYMKYKGINDNQVTKDLELSNGLLGKSRKKDRDMSRKIAISATNFYKDLSASWLLAGEGEMLVKDSSDSPLSSLPHQKVEITDKHGSTSQVDAVEVVRVPLIPFEARGGQLNGFANNGVTLAQCETVPTPFKGAQFAISVRGQSMSPTYPSGCVLFISKNIADWVEWGKVYVLDTENGVIVKQLAPSTLGEDFVCCKSFNDAPEFAPFNVPKASIFGIYRVVGALIET